MSITSVVRKRSWGLILVHLGLLAALASAFAGRFDKSKLRSVVVFGETCSYGTDEECNTLILAHTIAFQKLPSLSPSGADVIVDGRKAHVAVNAPYHADWCTNIYLMDKGDDYCVFETVRNPWKYLEIAGILMLMLGSLFPLRRRNCLYWLPLAVAAVLVCLTVFVPSLQFVSSREPLQSRWFIPHVTFYAIGYLLLSCSFLLALVGLVCRTDACLKYTGPLVGVGVAFLTLGMSCGAMWAQRAWGDFWTWDPKETWAAVTWCIYLIYLHLKPQPKRRYGLYYLILILAFASLQMCWWGLRYLPSAAASLHVYQ